MQFRHFSWSMLVHITFLGLICVGLPKVTTTIKPMVAAPILAEAVSEKDLNAELEKIQKQESKRLAENKKAQEELINLKKKKDEQLKAVEKLKKEQELLKKKQAEEEAKLKEARLQEEKQKLEAKRKQLEEEKLRGELMAKEAMQITRKEIQYFAGIIQNRIRGNWVQAYGIPEGLKCQLEVETDATGAIQQVIMVQSSGHAAFDRSAESAVLKSSPIPLPNDPTARKEFKRFRFTFAPEIA